MKRLFVIVFVKAAKYKTNIFYAGYAVLIILSGITKVFSQSMILDSTFGNNGVVITPAGKSSEIKSTAVQNNGKIIACGYSDSLGVCHFRITRYNSYGTLDNTFGNYGTVNTNAGISEMPYALAIQQDGRIVSAGALQATNTPPFIYHSILFRHNSDGSPDNSFGTNGSVITIIDATKTDMISSMCIQPDDKIIVGGVADNQFLLMRYNPDGTFDNNFGNGGTVKTTIEQFSSIHSIALQNDGKIIATGTTGNGMNSKFAIARYCSNGSSDTTFGNGGISVNEYNPLDYDVATSVVLLPGGKIISSGYSGSCIALLKYNNDGLLDTSFASGGVFVSGQYPATPQNSLAIQADGKIIVCGSTYINIGYPYSNYGWGISGFNSDGTPDNSFGNMGTIITDITPGNDYAQCLTQQQDGKIIIAGSSRDTVSKIANFTLARIKDLSTDVKIYFTVDSELLIYPNPASSVLSIELATAWAQNFAPMQTSRCRIYNVLGSEIMNKTFTGEKLMLDVGGLARGLYLLKIESEEGVAARRFVKE